MTNIWSNNKYIELTINIMLFLLGINFIHLGQLFLPLICLLLFVDRKFIFKVNNIKTFIVLCLFGISFFIFSYKLGFYAVMGFTLPMAYYIGSNMNRSNKNNLKYVIYLLAFSMSTYLLINFAFELTQYPLQNLFAKVRRYDIWTRQLIRPTLLSVHGYILIGTMYYLLRFEKNRLIKVIGTILFINLLIYNVAMARRTIILFIILSLLLCLFLDIFFTGNIRLNNKTIFKFLIILIVVIIIICSLCYFNVFGIWDIVTSTGLYDKLVSYGFKSERINYLIEGIKLVPYHLWGGQEISSIIGIQIHDLWSDIYDYAGLIPWALIVVYSLYCLKVIVNTIKLQDLSKNMKLLLINIFLIIAVSMMMEPAFTSTSVYVITAVILVACIECKIKEIEQ